MNKTLRETTTSVQTAHLPQQRRRYRIQGLCLTQCRIQGQYRQTTDMMSKVVKKAVGTVLTLHSKGSIDSVSRAISGMQCRQSNDMSKVMREKQLVQSLCHSEQSTDMHNVVTETSGTVTVTVKTVH